MEHTTTLLHTYEVRTFIHWREEEALGKMKHAAGIGGDDHPAMEYIEQHWIKEVEVENSDFMGTPGSFYSTLGFPDDSNSKHGVPQPEPSYDHGETDAKARFQDDSDHLPALQTAQQTEHLVIALWTSTGRFLCVDSDCQSVAFGRQVDFQRHYEQLHGSTIRHHATSGEMPILYTRNNASDSVVGQFTSNYLFLCTDTGCLELVFERQANSRRHYEHTHSTQRVEHFCPIV